MLQLKLIRFQAHLSSVGVPKMNGVISGGCQETACSRILYVHKWIPATLVDWFGLFCLNSLRNLMLTICDTNINFCTFDQTLWRRLSNLPCSSLNVSMDLSNYFFQDSILFVKHGISLRTVEILELCCHSSSPKWKFHLGTCNYKSAFTNTVFQLKNSITYHLQDLKNWSANEVLNNTTKWYIHLIK